MIKSLTVTNHLDESIKIVLGDSDTSGFLITNIEGLGPGKAAINSTEMASGDGSIYNSSRLESRNIVISMVYDYRTGRSIEYYRHKSYKYFPIKKRVLLSIETERRICQIEGYVESNEPMIFSPMSGTQVSIMCPDPYFYSAGVDGENVTEFGSTMDGFEFTYEEPSDGIYIPQTYGFLMNDADSEDGLHVPKIEFGVIDVKDRHNIYYSGDTEVGMVLTLMALNNVGDIVISDMEENRAMCIKASRVAKITGSELIQGDIIVISTLNNHKYVKLYRDDKVYNILNALDKGANWFKLYHGDNIFTYKTSKGDIQLRIVNRTKFEGA